MKKFTKYKEKYLYSAGLFIDSKVCYRNLSSNDLLLDVPHSVFLSVTTPHSPLPIPHFVFLSPSTVN